MANKPISEYDELENITVDTVFVVSRNGQTYGVTVDTLLNSLISGGDD